MQYRIRLGFKEVGVNLCADPIFNVAADWTVGLGWNLNTPSAEWTAATGSFLEYDPAIFTQYKRYRIKFTVDSDCSTAFIKVFIGDYSSRKLATEYALNDYVYEGYCLGGTKLRFYSWASTLVGPPSITNVEVYELEWNDPMTSFDYTEASLNFEKSTVLDGTMVNFANKVIFWGDTLDYIEAQAILDYTGNVPSKIEYLNGVTWDEFHLGQICLADVYWQKGIAEVVIGDSLAVDLIRKNINFAELITNIHKTFYLSSDNPCNQIHIHMIDPPLQGVYLDWPIPGIYNQMVYAYDAFKIVKVLIYDAIGLEAIVNIPRIATEAHPLTLIQGIGLVMGTTRGVGYAPNSDRDVQDYGINLSIQTMLQELNCLYNLGIAITQTSGIPTIIIDDKVNLQPNTIVLTLNNINDANYRYEVDPRNIKMGYQINYDNRLDASINLTAENKSPENELNLVSTFIADSDIIIEQLADSTAQQYGNYFWIQRDGGFSWKQTVGVTRDMYNQDFNIDDNIARHMPTLRADFVNIDNIDMVQYQGTYIYLKKYEFTVPISIADIIALRTTPYFRIVVNGYYTTYGYLDYLEYNLSNQNAIIKLIGT